MTPVQAAVTSCVVAAAFCCLSGQGTSPRDRPTHAGYRVVHVYPHDPQAFTQGLIFADGVLFESTGLNGRSSLRRVELETGAVLQQQAVETKYFAEGLTEWRGHLIQLTWQAGLAFVYDSQTFQRLQTLTYPGEGWGLTHDDRLLILSDGTSTLRFLDPSSFQERRRVRVTDRGDPVDDLNELEFVNGEVFANVWHSDEIARINPDTGRVTGWINLEGLLPEKVAITGDAVLNGIAYDAKGDRLFVTGKLWPKLFEIRVEP